MVAKRSEYRREYKVSSLQRNIPVYFENLSVRNQRRDHEFAHTPISWDFESTSDSGDSPVEEVDRLPIPELKITEEKEEEIKEFEERVEESKEELEEKGEEDVEIIKQSQELTKSAKEKLNKYSSKENKDSPSPPKPSVSDKKEPYGKTFVKPAKLDEKTFIKKRPQRPDRFHKVPRLQLRPASAPSKTTPTPEPCKKTPERAKKAPFVAYGSGGKEKAIGNKHTFNVRCSSAVYPAALRAQKRSAMEIQRREERRKKADIKEKRKQALFNDKLIRETAEWQSEYQRNYPAYSNTIYERAASARSQFKQPSIIAPFMRYSVQ